MDSFMNIAMEQTEEYQDGQLKAKYGDCFIRGNNGRRRRRWSALAPVSSIQACIYIDVLRLLCVSCLAGPGSAVHCNAEAWRRRQGLPPVRSSVVVGEPAALLEAGQCSNRISSQCRLTLALGAI